MRIAVTGASGFIGRNLCAALRTAGHEVLFEQKYEDVNAVIHLAALAHGRGANDEQQIQEVNVDLAEDVGRAAASAGCRMIFVSSIKVHGEQSSAPLREESPLAARDPYAESKVLAEHVLRALPALELTVLRPPLVYGPGVKANFLALMKAIARGMPLPLAGIENRRSLVYVGNFVDAIARCLASPQSVGRTYLVSDGAAVSTPQLCRAIGAALGKPARLFPFPKKVLPSNLTNSLELDDAAIRGELDWRPPYSMEEGLRATAQWYRSAS